MPIDRDEKGRFIKQNPPTIQPSTRLTTPIAGRTNLEELDEKQRSGQRLTLIERHTLLALEVKIKQSPKETPFLGKQKETRKRVVEQLEQLVLEQIKIVQETKNQPHIETLQIYEQEMNEEGEGDNMPLMTLEQRIEYERQQREWKIKREEERRLEAERKKEEDKRIEAQRRREEEEK